MHHQDYKILDNPVWNALQTVHSNFASGTETIQRYPVDVLQLIGCQNPGSADLCEAEAWISEGEKVFLVGTPAPLPPGWKIWQQLNCVQMICPKVSGHPPKTGFDIVPLTENDHDAMLGLVNLVQPGYFYRNTPLLGNYYGIRLGNELVAIAGERLKISGFTEISAVCTHPQFTGRGFAQQLVHHLVTQNLDSGSIPFLHFAAGNTRAQRVYQLLGFSERRMVPFWQLGR
ncbi:hypothetical protein DYBT9275_05962 [Dyadobacter sp. CECT 9275]|uniref:N-acetyltransferase domain-containing protein n=1 Tax=Dyadobacter helix TaxID=2822344 RepID=A0A916NER0_9BACT|nr:GNAT family N-acetyltransferase [Dyadobacter sp. CECT 9275]CAG5018239.1 hypothetical protein DYBT9275_05962 [Dyadobacter sp. CECT 9275]